MTYFLFGPLLRSNVNTWFSSSIISHGQLFGSSFLNVSTIKSNKWAIFTSILQAKSGASSYMLIAYFDVEIKYAFEQNLLAPWSEG